MNVSQTTAVAGFRTQTQGVSVVLPAYNEADNIRPLAMELQRVSQDSQWDYEVIWVNDGSTDGTAEEIDLMCEMVEGHRGVHLARNCGQSGALAAGIDCATGDVIVPMDADGQNDPADIPRLVEELVGGEYDCVSGVRADRQDGLAKRIPSRIQTALTQQMCPGAGSDMGCTLKAYRASALADVDLRGEHHRYIPAKLAQRGYALTERKVNHREREHGESHYGAGRLVRGFLDAIYHLLIMRYGTRPIHLFGSVGLVMAGVGGLLGAHLAVERLVLLNPISQHMPRLVLIAVLVLGGLLTFAIGVLAELFARLLYRDERPYRIQEVVE